MDDDEDEMPAALSLSTSARLVRHEAVCAERYKNLLDRIKAMDESLTEMKAFAFRAAYYIGFGVLTICGWLIVHYVLNKG